MTVTCTDEGLRGGFSGIFGRFLPIRQKKIFSENSSHSLLQIVVSIIDTQLLLNILNVFPYAFVRNLFYWVNCFFAVSHCTLIN